MNSETFDDVSGALALGIMTGVTVLVIILTCGLAGAQPVQPAVDEATAVACILGEARASGYEGMLAIAGAIRNRGHVRGVYGCTADFSSEMAYIRAKGIDQMAVRAWQESANRDITGGADHWGGRTCDAKWIQTMRRKGFVQTAEVGGNLFFREDRG